LKASRAIVLLLSIFSSGVCLAQNSRPGPDPVQSAFTQAMREGRFADAEKLVTEAIHDLEQSDPQNPRLATYLKYLSGIVGRTGRPGEEMTLIQRALKIDQHAYGPRGLPVTNDLIILSNYARLAGNTRESEQYLEHALEIVRANTINLKSVSDVDLAAAVYGSLASLYIDEHRWTDAEPLVQQEKKLCELFEEPYRQGYALCGGVNARLAQVYSAEGRDSDAANVPHNQDSPPELAALNATAEKFQKDGLYPSAEETYKRAIALAEKLEPDPRNHYGGLVVAETTALGHLYEMEGLKEKAERTYLSAFEFNESKAGPERGRSGYARMLDPNELVSLYRSEGRWKDAEAILQRVLKTQEADLGEENRTFVQTLTTFARFYEDEGEKDGAKYTQSRALYERALALQQVMLGPTSAELLVLLEHYEALLDKLQEVDKAAEVRARINSISQAQR